MSMNVGGLQNFPPKFVKLGDFGIKSAPKEKGVILKGEDRLAFDKSKYEDVYVNIDNIESIRVSPSGKVEADLKRTVNIPYLTLQGKLFDYTGFDHVELDSKDAERLQLMA